MSRPTVYVETSVIGYLLGRIHPDPVISGRQAVTRQWWPIAQRENELLVSELVMQECGAGDPVAAAERLEVLRGLRLLRTPKDAHALAQSFIAAFAVPATEPRDAAHIGIAATSGVEFLVTWNFKHIANVVTRDAIEAVCCESGYEAPTICTPDELLGASGYA